MSGPEIFELPPRSVEVGTPRTSSENGPRFFIRTDEGHDAPQRYFLYDVRGTDVELLGTATTRTAVAARAGVPDIAWSRGDEAQRMLVGERRRRFLIKYIEALFGTAPKALSADEIEENAANWMADLPAPTRRFLSFGLWALEKLLEKDFVELTIPERQQRIDDKLDDYGGLLKDLGKLRTIFYASYFQDPRSWPAIGFVPPPERPNAPPKSNVDELRMGELDGTDSCDWLVIGSGAGGAPAAAALAAKGFKVLVIDKGKYWPVRLMTHEDTKQYAEIYVEGGLQASANQQIAILQGSAIGGSSLINNCICFRLSESGWTHPGAQDVLDTWSRRFGVTVDRTGLDAAFDFIERRLEVHEVDKRQTGPNGNHLLSAWKQFLSGPNAAAADRQAPARSFKKNYGTGNRTCWACGYCNSGCAYHRKNSVAQTLLVDAQRAPVQARIVDRAEAVRINFHHAPSPSLDRARSVEVRRKGRSHLVTVREGVVVAAGVGPSSDLLNASVIAGAGRNLSCNLACPVVARMPNRMDSWNGLQMGSYVDRGTHLIESWFHPPATFCATVGGWFEEFMRRMSAYSDLVCFAVVMPVSGMGRVSNGQFSIALRQQHVAPLRAYVEDVVRLHLAGGAIEVYLPSSRGTVVRPGDDVASVVRSHFNEPGDFIVSTAHPQGGNPMALPSMGGIVDRSLRVYGTDNLYVADASIFPSSIRVNPQLAVMAFSHARFSA